MKFTLITAIAYLLATPGESNHNAFKAQDVASCKKYDDVLKKTTNNLCNYDLIGESKVCENALYALPIKTSLGIALRAKKCKDDVVQKLKQDIEDKILESVISGLETDDKKETEQPVHNKKDSSKTVKINITELNGSYQRRDM